MDIPSSLRRTVSPPPRGAKKQVTLDNEQDPQTLDEAEPSLAAVEAGQAKIRDHLAYFSEHLRKAGRPIEHSEIRLTIDDFVALYQRNQHPHGHHFVIHQHNHPIAGTHYDLRLQFSDTSTVSWAIPYGLPGNPNSKRQGRMAIETRVHNLWNNLIESASHATGSLLIWDTGKYSVLPRRATLAATDDELSDQTDIAASSTATGSPENAKLVRAFQTKYIRLRLHGTRLPKNYTVTLRLPSANDRPKQPRAPSYKRRRQGPSPNPTRKRSASSTDSESDIDTTTPITLSPEKEAALIRASNAYTGATNSIGSIHQRHWYLSLDRRNSGFVSSHGTWDRNGGKGFETFYVQGAEVERSIVTGRTSAEIMSDEGVEGFVARKRWRPVME
ncbi:hypothetical protein NA57DRAFT_33631 [Rhizodiscina lignyota]|uniref:DNA ligase D 3'-phosphoesterase domain-containing protein n=1 Tax=Rhizodiscina lignyota TaxID=1504668 RepID=A0A9P4INE3_9PEZI|nr:hypothetical protein NA57DRAFT_33631 [Rhizodiscina lignyota]